MMGEFVAIGQPLIGGQKVATTCSDCRRDVNGVRQPESGVLGSQYRSVSKYGPQNRRDFKLIAGDRRGIIAVNNRIISLAIRPHEHLRQS
jgi:hypothetical protein